MRYAFTEYEGDEAIYLEFEDGPEVKFEDLGQLMRFVHQCARFITITANKRHARLLRKSQEPEIPAIFHDAIKKALDEGE